MNFAIDLPRRFRRLDGTASSPSCASTWRVNTRQLIGGFGRTVARRFSALRRRPLVSRYRHRPTALAAILAGLYGAKPNSPPLAPLGRMMVDNEYPVRAPPPPGATLGNIAVNRIILVRRRCDEQMAYVLDLPRLPLVLLAALTVPVVLFVGLNLILGAMLFFGFDDQTGVGAFLRFFDLNAEQTVPAWYSTALLIVAAVITAATAVGKSVNGEPFVGHWYGLSGIFVYLSMDEALEIHERAIEPVSNVIPVGGLLYFAWVVPGAIAVLAVGLIYLRFLANQPRRLARNMVLAGSTYVGGALILEMVGGLLFETYGPSVQTDLVSMLEEVAEMGGIIFYNYALVSDMMGDGIPRSGEVGSANGSIFRNGNLVSSEPLSSSSKASET